jgi:dihydrofolate synthase / folylpolyglutamate synthase
MSRPATLAAWLAYLETLHPKSIALGLTRVRAVQARMHCLPQCPAITVTGTNGKGSTCAMLDSILGSAGYRVGLYTSPHLLRYNERVRIAGREATDDELLAAFHAVEDARTGTLEGGAAAGAGAAGIALTYFEFATLAALWLFARAGLDALVLEVGLGGRLDAVNIVDPDIAVVTSVDFDHMDYLGATREEIGREKAGIFRAARPVICADAHPTAAMLQHAEAIGAPLYLIGRDYGYLAEGLQWQYWGPGGKRFGLPYPALRGHYQLGNAATVLATLDLMRESLPIAAGAIREGLLTVDLPARFQVLPGRPTIVLDVAHNPHAARALAGALGAMNYYPETRAVLGILADKDIAGIIGAMRSRIDRWFVATLPGPRGATAAVLAAELTRAGVASASVRSFGDVAAALRGAREGVSEADRIVVFGSFLTVAAALAAVRTGPTPAQRHA